MKAGPGESENQSQSSLGALTTGLVHSARRFVEEMVVCILGDVLVSSKGLGDL